MVTLAPVAEAAPAASGSAAPTATALEMRRLDAPAANALTTRPGVIAVLPVEGLDLGGGGGVVLPGPQGSLSGLAAAGAPPAVLGRVTIGPVAFRGAHIYNAGAVVAAMSAGLRRCYHKGLQLDPNMKGSGTLLVQVGPIGEVNSVSSTGLRGLHATVVACVTARVRAALFAPPDDGSTTTLTIPLVFLTS